MGKVQLWFERKFEFTFPVEQYPNLYVRLRGTPARLEEMLRDVAQDILVSKRGDKWSVQEHAGHLLDLEPLWLARVNDFLSDGNTLTVADLNNRKTDKADHNSHELPTILSAFRTARFHLLERLNTLPIPSVARTKLHPRLKQPMQLVDHLYFVAEHDDHHLARIWEMMNP